MFLQMKTVLVRSINDGFFLFNIRSKDYEVLTPRRLQFLQKKYKINIEIHFKCSENGSKKFYVPAKKNHEVTLCILLEEVPKTSRSILENFEIINDRKKLFHEFVCDVTKNCKYSTPKRSHYERHRRLCKNFNTQKIIYKQRTFGERLNILEEMIDKNIIPWYARDYQNDFIATFDCETIEEKIEGPENRVGMTEKASLNLLSIAVGSNCDEIESKCWIRKTSAPEEEERIGQLKNKYYSS